MIGDNFFEAVRKVVLRVLNERNEVDFRAWYAATVEAQSGNEVDVTFDDKRLKTKNGVPLASMPGRDVQLRKGTRVLVGWVGGDESKPRAHVAWDGGGGVDTLRDVAATSWTIDAPTVSFSGNTKTSHLSNGSEALGLEDAVGGPALGSRGRVVSVGGGDVLAKVEVQTDPQTPGPPGPIFTLLFKTKFDGAPDVLVGDIDQAGAAPVATAEQVTLMASATLDPAKTYRFRLLIIGPPG